MLMDYARNGLIDGHLVVKRNVSPFLATLAMMTVLQGIRFYYTQGAPGRQPSSRAALPRNRSGRGNPGQFARRPGYPGHRFGRGYELDSIIAAVIGGIALTGGRGSPINSVLGAIILMLTFNFVVIVGLPVQAQFISLVIIAAVALFRRAAS